MTDSIVESPNQYAAAVQATRSGGNSLHVPNWRSPATGYPSGAGAVASEEAVDQPPIEMTAQRAVHHELCEQAANNRTKFWADQARELLWDSDFSEVLDWSSAPFARWFVGGRINVTVNCLDRHVAAGNGDRVAIHWVGDRGDRRDVTYDRLLGEVGKAANYFSELGLSPGDRVAICMPMIPEAIVAMLACARLGLVHLTMVADSSSEIVRSQLDDSRAKLMITADGLYRQGVAVPLKSMIDEALESGAAPCRSVERVIVVRRTGANIEATWDKSRDVWWQDAVGAASEHHEARSFDAEHPLFLLYTPRTEGQPRGIVHSSGGYLTQARYTFRFVFDHAEDVDIFWCDTELATTAGHTYQVYGPLSAGATSVIYEGGADFLDEGRHVQIIADYGVTTYYVAPNSVRRFINSDRNTIAAESLSSLRLVGTLGEPDNEPARRWCHEIAAGDRCRVVVTWWQDETGAIVVAPHPGVTAAESASAMSPLPGISAHIVDDETDLVGPGKRGHLVMDRPWPSMARGIWGDDDRFIDTYWRRFGEHCWYSTGIDARYDDEDAIWMLGGGGDVV